MIKLGRTGSPNVIRRATTYEVPEQGCKSFTMINQGTTIAVLYDVDRLQPGEFRVFNEFKEHCDRIDRVPVSFDASEVVPPVVAVNKLIVYADIVQEVDGANRKV